MEQWIQYIMGFGVTLWFLKELIKRTDKLEKSIDKIGDELKLLGRLFVTKDRCKELREVQKCNAQEDDD